MDWIPDGGVVTPAGFRAAAVRCGIKQATGALDVAMIAADGPATAAGVFTTNRFAAASVQRNRRLLPADAVRAVVVNAGNANACTGEQGARDAQATAALAGELLGCRPEQVLIASTGVIGRPLPMDKLTRGVRDACAALSREPEAAALAARAIMTTDTVPKTCALKSDIAGRPFHIGAMAKGAGMIAPHMATMLCFVTTDAAVPAELLHGALRAAADRTVNRITVDGDSSTNDSVIVLASGASGARVRPDGAGLDAFGQALQAALAETARRLVADGEGATKLIRVRVSGARDEADAERAARAVAESLLVKCAVYGNDPNWGRIVCALGYSGAEVAPERTVLHIGAACVFRNGVPTGDDGAAEMRGDEVVLCADLGVGSAEAELLTCDLTEEYVRINAEYTT